MVLAGVDAWTFPLDSTKLTILERDADYWLPVVVLRRLAAGTNSDAGNTCLCCGGFVLRTRFPDRFGLDQPRILERRRKFSIFGVRFGWGAVDCALSGRFKASLWGARDTDCFGGMCFAGIVLLDLVANVDESRVKRRLIEHEPIFKCP